MILSENRYPLFGIMQEAWAAPRTGLRHRRGGAFPSRDAAADGLAPSACGTRATGRAEPFAIR